MEEYPFSEFVKVSDKFIKDDRLHPVEMKREEEEMKRRMDERNREY
jgi:hypothetical protein